MSLSVAQDAAATRRLPTDIPAQGLGPALQAFAQSRDLQVLYFSGLVRDRLTRGVSGELTTDEALTRLLSGTGLTYRYVDDKAITILPMSSDTAGASPAAPASSTTSRASRFSARFLAALAAPEAVHAAEPVTTDRASAPAGAAAAAAGEFPKGLEELIVTARRREERLQDVPASIAAASEMAIADLNIVDMTELDAIAPGLMFVTKPGRFGTGPAIAIRGISTFTQSSAIQDSVGIVLDGVPVSRAKAGAFPDLSDVERVEVLRGPQGTLFGKNASAGVISISTKNPSDEFEAQVGLGYASHNDRTINAALSGPLRADGQLRGRLSVYSKDRDGFIENVFDGSEWDDDRQNGVRGKLVYEPTDKDTIKLSADFLQQDNDAGMQTTRAFLPSTPQYVRNALASIAGIENDRINAHSLGDNRQRAGGAALQWDHSLGAHTLTAIGSYRRWTQDAISSTYRLLTPLDEGYNFVNIDADQYSGELRLASPDGERVEYVAGLFVLEDEIANSLYDPPPGNLTLSAAGAPVDRFQRNYANNAQTSNYAAFGETDIHLTDHFTVTAGARYTHEKVSVRITGLPIEPGMRRVAVPLGVTEDSQTAEKVSWRLGGQWRFDADKMVYLSASTGFKGPGFNTVNSVLGDAQPVKPETSTSFEAGWKSQFLDRRLTLNFNLYHATFEDFQVQGFLVEPGTSVARVTLTNAAELETRGVEAELAAHMGESTELSLNATYIDATYKKFVNAQCYTGQPRQPGECEPNPQAPGSFRQDRSGERLANAPEWSFNVMAKQGFRIPGILWNSFATLDYSWRSEVQWDQLGHPLAIEGSYGLLGASLGFQSESERWALKLYGKNVTDEFHTSGIVIGQVVSQFLPVDYRRIVGIDATFRF